MPFLWYWDAFPVKDGWNYLNRAGREQELIRWEVTPDSWKVEVRVLEFRSFLAASNRDALIRIDYTSKIDAPPFDRVDSTFQNDWAHVDFFCTHELGALNDRSAFSGISGEYIIKGLRTSRLPRSEERAEERDYPTFIYGLDSATGQPLTHICDPDKLGTYFDKDGTRLHYLTPVYFKREVLQPYAAEPGRYNISSSRLTCLNLWGVDISFNSIGLVEVYLGDLGSDLPSEEWGHWRSYNVPPEGEMDEGRFRRDFLNQAAHSKDIPGDLRRARAKAVEVSTELFGTPLWKPLSSELLHEFNSLIGPLTEDGSSLGPSLLILTKSLVDGIDPTPLKIHVINREKGDQSLRLLQKYVQQIGAPADTISILFELQNFRSKGGIAHLAGSQKENARVTLGISDMSNFEAFESVSTRITECLTNITELMKQQIAANKTSNTTEEGT
ncbi:hypothetical protein GCM10009634_60470 [Saccharothrix xinjiangensis]